MVKKVVKINNITGSVTTMENCVEGGFLIETKTNVDPVINVATKERNEYRPNSLIGNTQKHHQKIGEIPMDIFQQLVNKFGEPAQNPNEWKKWLRENPSFRTTSGNL